MAFALANLRVQPDENIRAQFVGVSGPTLALHNNAMSADLIAALANATTQ